MSKKTLLIHHSADFDGTISASIVLDHYKDRLITRIGYNYQKSGSIFDNIKTCLQNNDFQSIIIVDVTLPDSLLDLMVDKEDVLIIDHHISEYDRIAKFTANNSQVAYVFGKSAACLLTWQYFNPNKPVPELITYAAMYDVFNKTGTGQFEFDNVLRYQYALRSLYTKPEQIIGNHTSYFPYQEMMLRGETALSTLTAYFDSATNGDPTIILDNGEKVFFTNTPKFDTIWADRLNIVYDVIVSYRIGKHGIYCSMRSSDTSKCDCSKVSKHFGGGGHHNAASFHINNSSIDLPIHDLLNSIVKQINSINEN